MLVSPDIRESSGSFLLAQLHHSGLPPGSPQQRARRATALESGLIVAKEHRASAGIPAAFRWPLEAALTLEHFGSRLDIRSLSLKLQLASSSSSMRCGLFSERLGSSAKMCATYISPSAPDGSSPASGSTVTVAFQRQLYYDAWLVRSESFPSAILRTIKHISVSSTMLASLH